MASMLASYVTTSGLHTVFCQIKPPRSNHASSLSRNEFQGGQREAVSELLPYTIRYRYGKLLCFSQDTTL
ncbi:hypothetical protein NFJ02_09g140630 [Pycnococcus provasolii]